VRLLESLGGTGRITNEPGGALLVTTSDNDLVRISGAGIAESLIDPPALFRFEGVYAPESGEIYVVDHRGATGSSGQGGLLRYNPVTSQADVIATGLGFPEAGDVTDDGTLVIANLAGSIQEWDPVTPAFLDAYSGGAGPRDVELWRGCSREAPCGDVDLDGHVSLLDPLLLRELLAGRGTLSDAQLARCSVVTPGTCSMVDVVALERLLAPGSLAPGLADICDTSL
jgi:hypothetical protein